MKTCVRKLLGKNLFNKQLGQIFYLSTKEQILECSENPSFWVAEASEPDVDFVVVAVVAYLMTKLGPKYRLISFGSF